MAIEIGERFRRVHLPSKKMLTTGAALGVSAVLAAGYAAFEQYQGSQPTLVEGVKPTENAQAPAPGPDTPAVVVLPGFPEPTAPVIVTHTPTPSTPESLGKDENKIFISNKILEIGGQIKDAVVPQTSVKIVVITDLPENETAVLQAGVEGIVVNASRVNASSILIRVVSGDYQWDFRTPHTNNELVKVGDKVFPETHILEVTYNPSSAIQTAFEKIGGGLPAKAVVAIGRTKSGKPNNISVADSVSILSSIR